MNRLIVFNNVSLDGYYCTAAGDMSWAHKSADDAEWQEYTKQNASGGGALVFGRVTYQMMASFWPTPQATAMMPEVASHMNSLPKFVFSRTLQSADWQNTTLLRGDLAEEVARLKSGAAGRDMAILGSGNLISQLAQQNLIDEYQLVISPVVLGGGRSMFAGVTELRLRLMNTRTFRNGNVLASYEPQR